MMRKEREKERERDSDTEKQIVGQIDRQIERERWKKSKKIWRIGASKGEKSFRVGFAQENKRGQGKIANRKAA